MNKTKSTKRLEDAIAGLIPFEDLTDRELKELERRVFRAVARKLGVPSIPISKTRH